MHAWLAALQNATAALLTASQMTAGGPAAAPSAAAPRGAGAAPAPLQLLCSLPGNNACVSRFKMPSTVPDDSAPFAPLASLEAESRPQQPQAAPHQLGSRRSLVESGGKVGSK